MYIQRSVLVLLVLLYVIFLAGVEWVTATGANWYRPFIVAFGVIVLTAWIQHYQEPDED